MKLDKDKQILFICDYGQSRSKYFADRLDKMGYDTQYAGFVNGDGSRHITETMIVMSEIVIILSVSWRHVREFEDIVHLIQRYGKQVYHFHINDESQKFKQYFDEFMQEVE